MSTKERPILFSGEMVRAILEGRKTQTRRPVTRMCLTGQGKEYVEGTSRYGEPGDRLWVRETWDAMYWGVDACDPYHHGQISKAERDAATDRKVVYRSNPADDLGGTPWQPSIFMKRADSRITLEITNVRVERLQEITFADCIAEGIPSIGPENDPECVRSEFETGWDALNAKRGYSWEKNPWVWVIEFKKI